MSTAQELPYLQAVPPLQDTAWRMALLLRARRSAQKAYDAARAVPAAAATFIRRHVHVEHLRAPLGVLGAFGRLGTRLRSVAQPVSRRMGGEGLLLVAVLLLTNSRVQRLLVRLGVKTLSVASNAVRWCGRLIGRTLRAFGRPGARTAAYLSGKVDKVGRTASDCTRPVVDTVVRTIAATEGLGSLITGFVRGWALHKLLQVLIDNRVLRLVIEAVILPVVAESRLLQAVQELAEQVQWRIWRIQRRAEQAQQPAEPTPDSEAATATQPHPAPAGAQREAGVAEEAGLPDPLLPGNRAERRAQQQHQARQRRQPRAA